MSHTHFCHISECNSTYFAILAQTPFFAYVTHPFFPHVKKIIFLSFLETLDGNGTTANTLRTAESDAWPEVVSTVVSTAAQEAEEEQLLEQESREPYPHRTAAVHTHP